MFYDPKSILLCDFNSSSNCRELVERLESQGFRITRINDRDEAERILSDHPYQMAIYRTPSLTKTDIDFFSSADKNNPHVLKVVLQTNETPELSDEAMALTLGACDWIHEKKKSVDVIVPRLKSIMGRAAGYRISEDKGMPQCISIGDMLIYPRKHQLFIADRQIPLSSTQMDILLLFMTKPGIIVKREDVLNLIDPSCMMEERTVDTHIKRIRKKFDHTGLNTNEIIRTIYGVGYTASKNPQVWTVPQKANPVPTV